MANKPLTPEQVLAWMAENPDALRLVSAEAALAVINGPEVTAALDVLSAHLKTNQDSAAMPAGQSRVNGDEGSREAVSRAISGITLARTLIARRIAKLTPGADPVAETEAPPEPPVAV